MYTTIRITGVQTSFDLKVRSIYFSKKKTRSYYKNMHKIWKYDMFVIFYDETVVFFCRSLINLLK